MKTLMLLVICYLNAGECARANDYLQKLETLKGKNFDISNHDFLDNAAPSEEHFFEGAKMFGRIFIRNLALLNPKTYANLIAGDPEWVKPDEFIADAKQRIDEIKRRQ